MKRQLIFAMLLWLAAVNVALSAETEFRMVTLQHRFAEDVLPAIESMVGENGSVRAIDNHLMITATPERLAAINEIITRLDVQRKNLRITVSHEDEVQVNNRSTDISGSVRNGDVEVQLPGRTRKGVAVDIAEHESEARLRGNEFLTVLDGERAFIHVGQSVPFTQQWLNLTQRYATLEQITEYRDITTGFAVRPRSVGNQVEVEITPRIARLNSAGFVDFSELATVVRATPGEWLDIGGIMQNRDEISRAILSREHGKNRRNSSLRIKIE
jgi:type II secretory pathway component GspD/PulD (secretin)